ncbi:MFS transporter [Pseudomonas sp. YQ_6]|jgi:MFS family permease|uniref:MFS transporter n=1 Tax=Pseudomonas putida S12 TaxID=1215087 RepID=A0AA34WPL2_PSEPU|nr:MULTISPECIES: MFS transporter [Pseudomonas]ADR59253.1 Major facilitator family transporter [Pseudomonas putida BIRD-1]AJA12054.1 MFS transporter [Pseudomonas putida S12]AOX08314.1 MFS transporter [Pseudomonas putida JB]MCI1022926.1 MFS transporter [Pseudomonas putida]MDN4515995.1 MFS transporter [Pseudomonas sp. 2,4-D]
MKSSASPPRFQQFTVFCIACFLLSISYGTTFLLSMWVQMLGGTASDAGQVFAVAMLSTLLSVVSSGHLLQRVGAARAIATGAFCLVVASVGFAVVPGLGGALLACGLMLGVGWGLFYTVGPIMVAQMVEPSRRTHCFALLSGSMLTGIGTGPLLGKFAAFVGLPTQLAFWVAACAAGLAGAYFAWLGSTSRGQRPTEKVQIGLASALKVMRSRSGLSILMVGLGGAIFGTMGSFQTSYAERLGLDYSIFFIGFMGAAIACRLLLAGWVVKQPPLATSWVLTLIMATAVLGFDQWVHSAERYLAMAMLLGVGYGLNYSVINGLAANEAPVGLTAQALLLFSLSYFIGVFGFPYVASQLITQLGINAMMLSIEGVTLLVVGLSTARWLASRFSRPALV